MAALTRSSLPWVPHTWMSGTDPLQTPRAWFWGTLKWAISAALLADGVSRTVGNVLVFGPPLHFYVNPLEMVLQSAVACSETKDGGLLVLWQLMECVLVWVVSSSLAVEDSFLLITDKSFDFSVGQMWWDLLLFPSFFRLPPVQETPVLATAASSLWLGHWWTSDRPARLLAEWG